MHLQRQAVCQPRDDDDDERKRMGRDKQSERRFSLSRLNDRKYNTTHKGQHRLDFTPLEPPNVRACIAREFKGKVENFRSVNCAQRDVNKIMNRIGTSRYSLFTVESANRDQTIHLKLDSLTCCGPQYVTGKIAERERIDENNL